MTADYRKLFEEGFKILLTKENLDPSMMAPQPQPQVAAPTEPPVPAAAPQAPVAQPAVTVDSVIDKLNVIRGGKSFKDAEVYGQLTTLFKSMPEQDKAVLDRVLTQIEQVAKSTLPQPAPSQPAAPMPPSPQPVAQPQQPAPPAAPPAGNPAQGPIG